MSSWSLTASRTTSLTRISPPSAWLATRAAIATLRPNRSSPRRTDLPIWMPMRTRMLLCRIRFASRTSSSCIATAQLTAAAGSAKATMNPSPWLLTTWPSYFVTSRRTIRSWLPMSLTHARSPMRSLSAVDSSMSENITTNLPSGASRARSGRSTSAQSASSSIEDRMAPPKPWLRTRLAVCHTVLTASRPPVHSMLRVSSRARISSASLWLACRRVRSTTSAMASATASTANIAAAIVQPTLRRPPVRNPELMMPPYYESRFIRANHPDRAQAIWLRWTLLMPVPGDAVADVWVMLFDPDGGGHRALKVAHPRTAADYLSDPWSARTAYSVIDDVQPRVTLDGASCELAITPGDEPVVKLLTDRSYAAKFPTAKTQVRHPLARFDGTVTVGDTRVAVESWTGSVNHNWGSKHTPAYAFGQVCGFDDHPQSTLEVVTARAAVGPLRLPAATLFVLRHAGWEVAVRSVLAARRTHGSYEPFQWSFGGQADGFEVH